MSIFIIIYVSTHFLHIMPHLTDNFCLSYELDPYSEINLQRMNYVAYLKKDNLNYIYRLEILQKS